MTIPKDLLVELGLNPKARSAFESMPPSHQKEYVKYIDEAKTLETRVNRIRKTISMILHPKDYIDKIGIKDGMNVLIYNFSQSETEAIKKNIFEKHIAVNFINPENTSKGEIDVIVALLDNLESLKELKGLKKIIKQNGAIWVISSKGKNANVKDTQVIQSGIDAGLVDNKVISFSEKYTGLRFVIRISDRK